MPEAKRLDYAVSQPAPVDPAWTPEHLVLAALARCSLASLSFHARKANLRVEATAEASGTVTRRDDGSWGFVELECAIEARIEPDPAELAELLARAERGCFVGASLEPRPSYVWTVNGRAAPS